MAVNVAVVGATGAVGDLMRKVLAERAFPIKSIKFLASEREKWGHAGAGRPLGMEPKREPIVSTGIRKT